MLLVSHTHQSYTNGNINVDVIWFLQGVEDLNDFLLVLIMEEFIFKFLKLNLRVNVNECVLKNLWSIYKLL